jgi:CheY-like chemotaxis protein
MLQSLAYKCDAARDGAEAVACYERYLDVGRPHDAVILDLDVRGGAGGVEALALLRSVDPDVRAIALTAGGGRDIAQRCLDLGFNGCIAKPFTRADLGSVLKSLLG